MRRANILERPGSAGQHDDLVRVGRAPQHFEQHPDPGIVGVDERVVEDERCRASRICQQGAKSQPRENGNLLARSLAECLDGLPLAGPL